MANVGVNIRCLRSIFGETQLELAQALGYESPATVSMYESGIRGQQNYEVISKIAYHYRITEDQLVYGSITSSGFVFEQLMKLPSFLSDILSSITPIFGMENERMDEGFQAGFKLHTAIYNDLITKRGITKDELDTIIQYYYKSNLPEAKANALWCLFQYGIWLFYGDLLEGILDVQNHKMSTERFLKDIYLRNVDPRWEWRDVAEEKKMNAFSEYEQQIPALLRELYATNAWHPVAEYYLALQYLLGLIDNGCRPRENTATGIQMMHALSILDNPYNMNYWRVVVKFHIV